MDNNNGLTYKRNFEELVWYQEFIFQDGNLIGEIHTDITEEGFTQGYLLKKAHNIMVDDSTPLYATKTIAYFPTVNDAKTFVNQAGGL